MLKIINLKFQQKSKLLKRMTNVWSDFEHKIYKKIKSYNLQSKKILLAVSGGLDSMALIEVFCNLKMQNNITVLHFHHGDFQNKQHRDDAQNAVFEYCKIKNIAYFAEKAEANLKSEDDFRSARHSFFNKYKSPESVLVTGHHLDDVLETRLIKMIRGAGFEGLNAFSEYNENTFRPFFDFSKTDIFEYAIAKKMTWVEDPTNLESHYLRNWLRQTWLPALAEKHNGGVQNLARSLDRVLDRVLENETSYENCITKGSGCIKIDRMCFFSLSTKDQLKVISKSLRALDKIDFTTGQLEEINKRLDKNQKDHIFELLGLKWVINAQQIMIRFVD